MKYFSAILALVLFGAGCSSSESKQAETPKPVDRYADVRMTIAKADQGFRTVTGPGFTFRVPEAWNDQADGVGIGSFVFDPPGEPKTKLGTPVDEGKNPVDDVVVMVIRSTLETARQSAAAKKQYVTPVKDQTIGGRKAFRYADKGDRQEYPIYVIELSSERVLFFQTGTSEKLVKEVMNTLAFTESAPETAPAAATKTEGAATASAKAATSEKK